MNFCIQDIDSLINLNADTQAYTVLWQQTVGDGPCMFFLLIVFVAVECSNCANLTSASRMVRNLCLSLICIVQCPSYLMFMI